ncbi:MAG TPA: sigma-70 family RNA polymerase sigma factor [Chthoniobacteraceae bacterium]|nr:sigma-70 family RNA polymerase sigma factor [Chthoniobacteraceae bacterium]
MLYAFDNQQLEKYNQRLAPGEQSDEQLMERIKARDEQALSNLYRRHQPLLRTVIGRVLNNDWDVDDLLQEVFLEIWRQAEHYCEEKGKALGWVVTLARRRAIDRVRKKQAYSRAQERYRVELERDPESFSGNDVDSEAATSEAHTIFQQVMSNLPTAQREALYLSFYRGLSQREIAASTGIPLGTIKTRLELAIRKVRSSILALGGKREWMPALMHN